MEVSGEVADLVVKEGLEATEQAAKLAANGMKNIAALLLAIAREDYKVSGKTSAKRLAKDPNAPTVTPLEKKDLQRFRALAKQYGVLYFIPKKKGTEPEVYNVVSTETYAAKLNAIYQALGYPVPEKESQEKAASKKAPSRTQPERSSKERGNGLKAQMRTDEEKPSVRGRLAALQAASKDMKTVSRERQKEHIR